MGPGTARGCVPGANGSIVMAEISRSQIHILKISTESRTYLPIRQALNGYDLKNRRPRIQIPKEGITQIKPASFQFGDVGEVAIIIR